MKTNIKLVIISTIVGALFFSAVYIWFKEYSNISTVGLPVKSEVSSEISSEIPVITVDSLTDQEKEIETDVCKTFNIDKGLYNKLTLEDTVELSQGKLKDYTDRTFSQQIINAFANSQSEMSAGSFMPFAYISKDKSVMLLAWKAKDGKIVLKRYEFRNNQFVMVNREIKQGIKVVLERPNGYIGITLTEKEEGFLIVQCQKDSPAMNAGLNYGDTIIAIDSASLSNFSGDVLKLLSGPAGSKVTLTIKRKDQSEPINIDVIRGNNRPQ